MSQIVADRYAQALFEIAQEHEMVERIDSDLTLITQTMAESFDLRRLALHPLVSIQDKKSAAREIFGPHLHPTSLNFLQLLFDRNRGSCVALIQARFHHLASQLAKRITVHMVTAVQASPDTLERMRERLEREWERKIKIEASTDPDLVGGVLMRVEDQVYDGSIRGRLIAMRRQLAQGGF